MTKIEIINGEKFVDERGEIESNNEFNLNNIKRFYTIHHPKKDIIRAWQGHLNETKYFKCIKGSFVIAWKKIDKNYSDIDNKFADHYILESNQNQIIKIPKGYANGLKSIQNNSSLLVFSDFNLKDSLNEKIRFSSDLWFDWSKF